MRIRNRVIRLEKHLSVRNDEDWALNVAKDRAYWERQMRPNLEARRAAIEREGGEKRELEPLRFQTEQDIENFARELSKKYASLEEYENQPINPKITKALTKALSNARNKDKD